MITNKRFILPIILLLLCITFSTTLALPPERKLNIKTLLNKGLQNTDNEKYISKLSSHGKDAARLLLSNINLDNLQQREVIKRTLIKMGSNAIEPIIRRMAVNKPIRPFCLNILQEIGDKKAILPILLLLDSRNPRVRLAAAKSLGNFQDTISVNPLIKMLNDTASAIREAAATSLGKLKAEKAIHPLISTLGDSNYSVRFSASYALAKIKSPQIGKLLLRKFDSTKGTIKFHILESLGRLRYEPAKPVILDCLSAPSHYIRGFACQALGFFKGDYRVANALKQALHDNSPFVQMKAENALERIQNKDDSASSTPLP